MKKAILTIAIAVMGLTAAFAQDTTKRVRRAMPKMTAEQRAEKVTARLEKQLSLTADQKTKIYAIELENAKKMEAWRSADQGDMKGKMKERKAAFDEQKAKIDGILTAEQKTKMDAFRAEAKEKGEKMRKGMGGRGKKDKAPVVSNPPAQAIPGHNAQGLLLRSYAGVRPNVVRREAIQEIQLDERRNWFHRKDRSSYER